MSHARHSAGIAPVRIPNAARIVVADARKALLLVNEGEADVLNLRIERVLEAPDNPPARDQATDRPGRLQSGGQRSAVEQTDRHREAEAAFAAEVAAAFLDPAPVLLTAPPEFLAELRRRMPASAGQTGQTVQVTKDLVHLPLDEIERRLAGGEG